MADIPTISGLQEEIENDLRTELSITKNWFGKVLLRVIAIVQAGKLKLFYLSLANILKNIFVDTATSEFNGGTLERFGRVYLGRDPYPAVAGVYTINITGVSGGVIKKGQTFKSTTASINPDKIFEVTAEVTLTGTTGTATVKALESGTGASLQVADELESTAPIENVDSIATVASIDTTAVEAEDLEDYRTLAILKSQQEPQGGAATDYRIWSADATGVRTVYPYTKNNEISTVQVFVEALPENSEPANPEGVPTASMLTDVGNVIDFDPDTTKLLNERGRRPVQTTVEVVAVVPVGVTITVNDLSDKSSGVLSAITEALEDLFYTIRPYIAGADGANRKDTLYLSAVIGSIYEAIDEGINFSNVTITIESTTHGQYTFGNTTDKYGTYPYLEELLTP